MPGDFIKTDLAAFLNSNELGDTAEYNGNTFDVQFFNEYEAVNLFGLEVESAKPLVIVKDSDILGIVPGAKFIVGKSAVDTMFVDTVDGQFDKSRQMEYKVIEIQPDNTGLSILILSKD